MGITGLLPFVKDACIEQVHLSELSNTVVVIDTYGWLHRSLIGACYEIYKGNSTTQHIDFCFKRINEFKKYNIKPIFVFDGRNLPAKAETEQTRRSNREKAKEEVARLLAKGDNKGAWKILPRTIDVSQDMARQLIDRLIENNIDYIVAPYEADVQMAYLVREGYAHFAVSEDSDLILYGCKYVLYKFNNESGVLYQNNLVLDCLGKEKSKFDFIKFRRMCILSGCDYLSSLTGIGLMKAKKFFATVSSDNIERSLPQLPKILNMKKLEVPSEYVDKYIEAENTFSYQLVFCPKEKKLRPFLDYDENQLRDQFEYAGSYFDDELALNFALGNVNHKTLEIYDDSFIDNKLKDKFFKSSKSIWNVNYKLEDPKRFDKIIKKLRPNFELPPELVTFNTSISNSRRINDKTKLNDNDNENQLKNNHKSKNKDNENKSSNKLKKNDNDESIKRKYEVLDSSTDSNQEKDKKQKTIKNSQDDDDEEDVSIISESSFKSEIKTITSIKSLSKSTLSESTTTTNTEMKMEVRSRFFEIATDNDGDDKKEQNTLDRINERRKAIRENLKKMYTKPASQDSGIGSQKLINSQEN